MASKEIELVSAFEQAETALTTVAMMVVSYYKELIKNGVPEELAAKLAKTYNGMHLSVILDGKDES